VPQPGEPLNVLPQSVNLPQPELGHERTALNDEVLGEGVRDTAEKYTEVGPDGVRRYTAARRELHRRWALEILNGHAENQENPEILFTAGGTASGKSSIIEEDDDGSPPPVVPPGDAVHLDQDIIKKKMKEYQVLAEARDGYASDAVHREASDVYRVVMAEAMRRRMNLIVEGTGNSGIGQFAQKIREADAAGYRTRIIYASAPTDVAIDRAEFRAKKEGRAVPLAGLRAMHANVSKRFEDVLATLDVIDELTVWDTREPSWEGGLPRIMYSYGYDGPPPGAKAPVPDSAIRRDGIVDEGLFNEFRDKALEDPGTLIANPTFV
jgi:predicted ABC-type ATPase